MLTVAHYIEFLNSAGESSQAARGFQPYFIGETRIFNGIQYQFSPYSIAGDISTDGNESGDYELIAPGNMITTAILAQSSEDRSLVKISTVLIIGTPAVSVNAYPTWTESSFLSSTICVCDSYGYTDAIPDQEDGEDNFSVVTLRLTNPLNFVTGTAPTRRLTAAQVGPLPSSGGITF